MTQITTARSDTMDDHLTQYAMTVHGLHQKLNRIRANKLEVAASLGRTAQALRSIAAVSEQYRSPDFRNRSSNLRECVSPEPSCTWGKLMISPER